MGNGRPISLAEVSSSTLLGDRNLPWSTWLTKDCWKWEVLSELRVSAVWAAKRVSWAMAWERCDEDTC